MPPKKATSTTARKAKPTASPSPAKNTYLLAYNAVSAALWAGVLYKTISISTNEIATAQKSGVLFSGNSGLQGVLKGLGSGRVYGQLENYTRLTQSLAGLEVLHSLLGTLRILSSSLILLNPEGDTNQPFTQASSEHLSSPH